MIDVVKIALGATGAMLGINYAYRLAIAKTPWAMRMMPTGIMGAGAAGFALWQGSRFAGSDVGRGLRVGCLLSAIGSAVASVPMTAYGPVGSSDENPLSYATWSLAGMGIPSGLSLSQSSIREGMGL